MRANPLPARHSTSTHLPWVKYSFHKFSGGQIESLIKLTGEEGAKHFPFLTQPHNCHLCFRGGVWRQSNYLNYGRPPAEPWKCPGVGHGVPRWFMWGSTGRGEHVPMKDIEAISAWAVSTDGVCKFRYSPIARGDAPTAWACGWEIRKATQGGGQGCNRSCTLRASTE